MNDRNIVQKSYYKATPSFTVDIKMTASQTYPFDRHHKLVNHIQFYYNTIRQKNEKHSVQFKGQSKYINTFIQLWKYKFQVKMQRRCTPYLWLQSLLQFLREKGGFDVRSVIKFQKKKEVENKKRKQNDAINENLQRKIKKRLHAVRVIVQWT